MTTPNVALIDGMIDEINTYPDRLYMGAWINHHSFSIEKLEVLAETGELDCGTTLCAAGLAIWQGGTKEDRVLLVLEDMDIPGRACELMGLPRECQHLFYADEWKMFGVDDWEVGGITYGEWQRTTLIGLLEKAKAGELRLTGRWSTSR